MNYREEKVEQTACVAPPANMTEILKGNSSTVEEILCLTEAIKKHMLGGPPAEGEKSDTHCMLDEVMLQQKKLHLIAVELRDLCCQLGL